MSRESLQSSIDRNSSLARSYDQRAGYYDDLAAGTRTELSHKSDQLERAKTTKARCDVVRSDEQDYVTELGRFGSVVAGAVACPEVADGLVRQADGMDGLAEEARRAAQNLVDELEAECATLRQRLSSYEAEASSARSAARRCRNNADSARRELRALP